jgi:hypothetical protein
MARPTTKPRRQSGRTAWEPTDWQCIGVLAALTGIFFLQILIGKAFLWEDFVYQWYPFRQFASSSLVAGELPLWNPYTIHGMPFLAEIQTQVFYLPMAVLMFMVKNGRLDVFWLELVNVLHYLLAGTGMYYLARSFSLHRLSSLFAAIAFAFSGFLVTHAIHQVIIGVVAWYPLLYLLFRKAIASPNWAWVFVAGLALGHSFFGGSPQMSLFFYLFLLCAFLFELLHAHDRKGLLGKPALLMSFRAALVVLISLGIAMVQFLPTQELSGLSARAQITFEKGSEGSLGWGQLLTLLVPKFFGVSDAHAYTYWGPGPYWHYWETCIYIGILPLLLALLSIWLVRKNRTLMFFWSFALFALLFSVGSNFFVHGAFFRYVPGFASFRNPARMGVFLPFIGSLLSAFSLDQLIRGFTMPAETGAWRKSLLVLSGAGFLVILLALLGLLDGVFPFLMEVQSGTIVRKELLTALVILAASAALVYVLLTRKWSATLPAVLACGLVFIDLYSFGAGHNTASMNPEDHFRQAEPLVRYFKAQDGIFRVNSRSSQGMIMDRNQGMVDHIFTMEGYTPLFLQRTNPPASTQEKAFDLLNIRYYTAMDSARGTLALGERKPFLPRAYMVFASTVTRSLDESIARLRDPAFDPWTMAVVEDPAHTPMIAPAEKPVWHATIDSYRNNAIHLTVESDHDGLLVLSETYYPGWRATVDDQPAPVFRTDHALRSVPILRGVRKVILSYAPESFRLGAIVTFGTLACCVVGIVLGWRRSRTPAGQPGHESKNA